MNKDEKIILYVAVAALILYFVFIAKGFGFLAFGFAPNMGGIQVLAPPSVPIGEQIIIRVGSTSPVGQASGFTFGIDSARMKVTDLTTGAVLKAPETTVVGFTTTSTSVPLQNFSLAPMENRVYKLMVQIGTYQDAFNADMFDAVLTINPQTISFSSPPIVTATTLNTTTQTVTATQPAGTTPVDFTTQFFASLFNAVKSFFSLFGIQ